jgi:hypothetical protein
MIFITSVIILPSVLPADLSLVQLEALAALSVGLRVSPPPVFVPLVMPVHIPPVILLLTDEVPVPVPVPVPAPAPGAATTPALTSVGIAINAINEVKLVVIMNIFFILLNIFAFHYNSFIP